MINTQEFEYDFQCVAQELFPIGPVRFCKLIRRHLRDVFIVVDARGEMYSLNVVEAKNHSKRQLTFECDYLEYMKYQNIPVSVPIKSLSNKNLETVLIKNEYYHLMMFRFVSGLTSVRHSRRVYYRLGEVLAKFHSQGSQLTLHPDVKVNDINALLIEPLQTCGRACGENSLIFRTLQAVVSEIMPQLASLPIQDLSYSYCHGNYSASNSVVTNSQITLSEIELLNFGYRIFDLAGFLWNEINRRFYQGHLTPWDAGLRTIWSDFLMGYQSICLLSETERNMVLYMARVQEVWRVGLKMKNNTAIQMDETLKRFDFINNV